MQSVALAWLVVELGASPVQLSVVVSAQFIPILVAGPLLGQLSDRFGPRRVLIATSVAQATVATVLALAALTSFSTVPAQFLLSLANGIAFSADQPARQVLVFDLVGQRLLSSAVALNEIAINFLRIAGPGIAGIVLALAGPAMCFLVSAAAFLPALVILTLMRMPSRGAASRVTRTMAGLTFVWRDRAVLAVLVITIFVGPVYNIATTMPVMASDVFDAGGAAYGAMLACFGLGALPGAVVAAGRPATPTGREISLLAVVSAGAAILCAQAPTLALLYVGLVLVGATSILYIARANAYVLLRAPADLRDKVMGIWTFTDGEVLKGWKHERREFAFVYLLRPIRSAGINPQVVQPCIGKLGEGRVRCQPVTRTSDSHPTGEDFLQRILGRVRGSSGRGYLARLTVPVSEPGGSPITTCRDLLSSDLAETADRQARPAGHQSSSALATVVASGSCSRSSQPRTSRCGSAVRVRHGCRPDRGHRRAGRRSPAHARRDIRRVHWS